MTITETLLDSHRFTNALFTKIASTLSQKPLLKKGAFCYPPFPGMPAPFLRGCPSARHGHVRALFPDSFPVFPKRQPVFYRPAFRTDPKYPGPPSRNQSSSGGQPAATRHEKTVRKDICQYIENKGSFPTKWQQAPASAGPAETIPLPVLPASAFP